MSVAKHLDMNLFDIAMQICSEGRHTLPEDFSVDVLCDPWLKIMSIWVNGFETGNTFVNIDYAKWVKARLERRAARQKPPCFISDEANQWLNAVAEIARSYGGVNFWNDSEIDTVFTFEGPYFHKYELRYRVSQAVEKVGLTYDDWKRFWRRNSLKIKKNMDPYFQDITQDFPCWRWR